jgi:hypothetical protein
VASVIAYALIVGAVAVAALLVWLLVRLIRPPREDSA